MPKKDKKEKSKKTSKKGETPRQKQRQYQRQTINLSVPKTAQQIGAYGTQFGKPYSSATSSTSVVNVSAPPPVQFPGYNNVDLANIIQRQHALEGMMRGIGKPSPKPQTTNTGVGTDISGEVYTGDDMAQLHQGAVESIERMKQEYEDKYGKLKKHIDNVATLNQNLQNQMGQQSELHQRRMAEQVNANRAMYEQNERLEEYIRLAQGINDQNLRNAIGEEEQRRYNELNDLYNQGLVALANQHQYLAEGARQYGQARFAEGLNAGRAQDRPDGHRRGGEVGDGRNVRQAIEHYENLQLQ